MGKKIPMKGLVILALILLCSGSALAMSSLNYKLDWFVPLTGGGGGKTASSNYALDFTVGQSVIGTAASDNYRVGLGYWGGGTGLSLIYLPIIFKN